MVEGVAHYGMVEKSNTEIDHPLTPKAPRKNASENVVC